MLSSVLHDMLSVQAEPGSHHVHVLLRQESFVPHISLQVGSRK